jgi:hypothetical protein
MLAAPDGHPAKVGGPILYGRCNVPVPRPFIRV